MWTRVGIPERDWRGGGVGKVREGGGRVGGGRAGLPESVRLKIAEKWAEIMAPRGFETYADFRDAVDAPGDDG
jgi:aryl sulfotransferase